MAGIFRDNSVFGPVYLTELASGPATGSNQGALYAKEVATITELFYRYPNSGTETQLTWGGVGPLWTLVGTDIKPANAAWSVVIDADLTVNGSLIFGDAALDTITVNGVATFNDQLIVDFTDASAFVVRKDAASGDVFNVDTTNSVVGITAVTDIYGTAPTLNFRDTDDAAVVPEASVRLTVNLTDAGDGTEDADLTVSQMIAGALTQVMLFDADGALEIDKTTLIKKPGIAATSTDGLVLQNTTDSTVGVPVQISPRLRYHAEVWDTDGSNDEFDFKIELVPTSAATTLADLTWSRSKNGAAYTTLLQLDETGNLTIVPQAAALMFANAQYIKDNGNAGLLFYALGGLDFTLGVSYPNQAATWNLSLGTRTAGAAGDKGVSVTQTLNDAATAGGETYTMWFSNLTETNKTGWPTVNLMDLQVDAVSRFLVSDAGSTTISVNGIATTSTDGLVLQNTTDSTVGVPVQISPRLRFHNEVWDTDGSNDTYDWKLEALAASAASTSTNLELFYSKNGGAYARVFAILSSGFYIDGVGSTVTVNNLTAQLAQAIVMRGADANDANAIGMQIGNTNTLSTAGAKIVSFCNDNAMTEKANISYLGGFVSLGGQTSITPTFSVASAAAAVYDGFTIPATTMTLTGVTPVTTATGFNLVNIAIPNIATSDALADVTNAATVYIAGAPTISGGGAITNPYAFWVDTGKTRLDGVLELAGDSIGDVILISGSSNDAAIRIENNISNLFEFGGVVTGSAMTFSMSGPSDGISITATDVLGVPFRGVNNVAYDGSSPAVAYFTHNGLSSRGLLITSSADAGGANTFPYSLEIQQTGTNPVGYHYVGPGVVAAGSGGIAILASGSLTYPSASGKLFGGMLAEINGGVSTGGAAPSIPFGTWTILGDTDALPCIGHEVVMESTITTGSYGYSCSAAGDAFSFSGHTSGTGAVFAGYLTGSATARILTLDSTGTSSAAVVSLATFKHKSTASSNVIDIMSDADSMHISGLSEDGLTQLWYIDNEGQVGCTNATFTEDKLIAGATSDGYSAALILDPAYNAAAAQTVSRHNYINARNVQVDADVTVTDAALVRFDAAAGTHRATVGATTKTTPTAVDGWIKCNVNGTLYYAPMYVSTTA